MLESQENLVQGFGEIKVLCKRSDLTDNRLNGLSQMWLRLPETGFDVKNSVKKVAGIIVPGNERITSQLFNGQRYQVVQTDILPDHDPEVFDRKIAERFSSESMASRHKVRGEIGLSPILPFK